MKAELGRKAIHLLIALVPTLTAMECMGRSNTALLLMGGILLYTAAESLRFLGFAPPLISAITSAVEREKEKGNFILGPVTLGLGALLTIVLFPPVIARAAIYALAFGDSAASLAGKCFGRIRPAFLSGKSLEGCMACFTAAALAAYLIFHDWKIAAATGTAAMIVDILPFEDFDNLLLPLAAGFVILLIK